MWKSHAAKKLYKKWLIPNFLDRMHLLPLAKSHQAIPGEVGQFELDYNIPTNTSLFSKHRG